MDQQRNEATGDPDLESIQAQRYAANGAPLGGQFQVNLHTTSAQANPSIGAGDDGAFVVIWGSDNRTHGDTDATAVRARRFAANGAATTGDFLVNTYTTSHQDYPSVTADARGNALRREQLRQQLGRAVLVSGQRVLEQIGARAAAPAEQLIGLHLDGEPLGWPQPTTNPPAGAIQVRSVR